MKAEINVTVVFLPGETKLHKSLDRAVEQWSVISSLRFNIGKDIHPEVCIWNVNLGHFGM